MNITYNYKKKLDVHPHYTLKENLDKKLKKYFKHVTATYFSGTITKVRSLQFCNIHR